MADIEIEKQHNLEFEQARAQAKKWLNEAEQQFGISADYVEGDKQDTVSINRTGIDGRAVLDSKELRFEAKLAFLAKPLKGRIKEELDNGISKYFS